MCHAHVDTYAHSPVVQSQHHYRTQIPHHTHSLPNSISWASFRETQLQTKLREIIFTDFKACLKETSCEFAPLFSPLLKFPVCSGMVTNPTEQMYPFSNTSTSHDLKSFYIMHNPPVPALSGSVHQKRAAPTFEPLRQAWQWWFPWAFSSETTSEPWLREPGQPHSLLSGLKIKELLAGGIQT